MAQAQAASCVYARMSLEMDGTLDFDCYSLGEVIWDVCLFKGGVVVLHTCLTNRICICRVSHSLNPTPCPGGCIIGRGHESSEEF